ncbi:MAG TPA: hypothetical protein VGA78_16065, partial [Gemmatimonadales bacterium]
MGLVGWSADLSWARGVSQTGYTDLNLAPVPSFALVAEANRPVYAPAAGIEPATGATSLLASRRHPQFGQVLSVDSRLESESYQLTLAANGITRGGIVFSGAYTLARSRDQASGGGFGSASMAGDPNQREWSTSDFERRHSFQTTATVPVGQSLEITSIGRLGSGVPFGGGPGAGDFLERFETLIPNPARQILELRLGLRLSDDQVRRLTEVGDSTARRTKELADSARAAIQRAGPSPDPFRLMGGIRPLLEQGQT